MVKNLVEKGNLSKPLLIYNRTKRRADDLSSDLGSGKTVVAGTIEEVVSEADIIFICLGDDKAITENVNTILAQDVKSKLLVDCSTVHPNTTNAIAKQVTNSGAHFVASPVFGAPAMANAGQLLFVLAGPRADVEKVKPYTKGVMGRADLDFSDQEPGKASLMKIIGNSMILHMVESLSEGHTVAETSGLGSDNLHSFIEAMLPGPFVAYSNR